MKLYRFISIIILSVSLLGLWGCKKNPSQTNHYQPTGNTSKNSEQTGTVQQNKGNPSKNQSTQSILHPMPKETYQNVLTKHFVTEDTRDTIDLKYVTKDNKQIVIYDSKHSTFSYPVSIPGTDDYLIGFNKTIYRTDWKNGILKKFLKDEVNGYKKDEFFAKQKEYSNRDVLVWGENPQVDPTGKYVLFYSNRSYFGGDPNGQTWVKNLNTGEEKPVLSGGIGEILGWVNPTTVILTRFNVESLDIETGESRTLKKNSNATSLIGHQIVYQDDPGSLVLQDVNNGKTTTVSNSALNRVMQISTHGSRIAVVNRISSDVNNNHYTINDSVLLYNVDTDTWKEINEPDNISFIGVDFLDDQTLKVTAIKKGTNEQENYSVKMDQLKKVQSTRSVN